MITALTIAGSDPSGGAGLELDLKVFQHFGAYGAAVATALTVQDPTRVHAVFAVDASLVRRRLEVLAAAFRPGVVKLGMLATAPIVEVVADFLDGLDPAVPVVVDPVLRSTSGAELLERAGVDALLARILRRAVVVLPNLAEARILCGDPAIGAADAARALASKYGVAFVVTGGDAQGSTAIDEVSSDRAYRLVGPRTEGISPHGTGCAFAAAIAAHLAHGAMLEVALQGAKRFIGEACAGARPLPGAPEGARRVLVF